MPRIRVKFSGPLSSIAGASPVDLELPAAAATVGSALDLILARFPAIAEKLGKPEQELRSYLRLFLNGQGVQFQGGLAAALQEGDELLVLVAVGGG
jgi:molybdopterin synthase sulfur carrier subunit